MRTLILTFLIAWAVVGVPACARTPQLPASLRAMETPPPPSLAVGTAILDEPSDNILTVHRLDGATGRLKESAFVATPDPWVVPHIGPLKWPAVFAVEEKRLWVWAESQWCWLDRGEARGTVAFVAYQSFKKRDAAQQAVAADGAAPRR